MTGFAVPVSPHENVLPPPLRPLFLTIPPLSPAAEDSVRAGAGSYATRVPEGAKLPPLTIYRTANVPGPMPTNDWWSSLAFTPLSFAMYPHPLAVRAMPGGLRVAYPGANITANKSAIKMRALAS